MDGSETQIWRVEFELGTLLSQELTEDLVRRGAQSVTTNEDSGRSVVVFHVDTLGEQAALAEAALRLLSFWLNNRADVPILTDVQTLKNWVGSQPPLSKFEQSFFTKDELTETPEGVRLTDEVIASDLDRMKSR
jgi:hypothetical protein